MRHEYGLKPCPFCGNKVKPFFLGEEDWKGREKGYISIRCFFCEATVTLPNISYYGPHIDIPLEETLGFEKVQAVWNERV